MITYSGKPITNVGSFPKNFNSKEKELIISLLIEEHGILPNQSNDGYFLESPIFTSKGYGDVLLSIKPRPSNTSPNQFGTNDISNVAADTLAVRNSLEQKYGVSIDGVVTWTGDKDRPSIFSFARFKTFEDFCNYINQRLDLDKAIDNLTLLSNSLLSYSGGVQGYPYAIYSISRRVKDVNL